MAKCFQITETILDVVIASMEHLIKPSQWRKYIHQGLTFLKVALMCGETLVCLGLF